MGKFNSSAVFVEGKWLETAREVLGGGGVLSCVFFFCCCVFVVVLWGSCWFLKVGQFGKVFVETAIFWRWLINLVQFASPTWWVLVDCH